MEVKEEVENEEEEELEEAEEVVGVVEEEEVGQDWRQGLGHQLCQAGELHWASSLPAPSAAVSGPS